MRFPEYEDLDALALAEMIRAGDVSAQEVLKAAIERIEARDPALNAVVHKFYDGARSALDSPPRGPFAGVPFLLKDLNAEVKGEPQSNGSRLLKANVSDHDSELVIRYRRAGLVFLGRSSSPEFGLHPTTEPHLFGPTRNPWDPARTSGGSSGGSGTAVAAGYLPVAHASDGGGSIRIPASCCGLFGLKPTRGRTPSGPRRAPGWNGATVDHVLTRSVRDSAAFLDATHGPDPGAPYSPAPPERPFSDELEHDPGSLRIAFTVQPFLSDAVDPACVQAVAEAAKLLEDLGHSVSEARPDLDGAAFASAFVTVIAAETAAEIRASEIHAGRRATYGEIEPASWALYSLGNAVSASDYSLANRTIAYEVRKIGRFFQDYDVLVTPTLAKPPVKLGTLEPSFLERSLARSVRALRAGKLLKAAGAVEEMAARTFAFVPYTPVFNASGQPAMSVPLHWHEGLPVGVHFVGPYGDEALLLRLAAQLERARPWFNRRPPLNA